MNQMCQNINGVTWKKCLYLRFGDLLVVLQRVPGDDLAVPLAAAQQRALRQHHQRRDALVVSLAEQHSIY